MMEEPLYIFFDLEAAHSDRFFGDIIEIAAQVDPRMLENEVFSSLVNTKQNLAYFGKDFVIDFSMEPKYLVRCMIEKIKTQYFVCVPYHKFVNATFLVSKIIQFTPWYVILI